VSVATVIVPVFNAFDHLCGCLESLEKTVSGLPVMLINDASTDSRVAPLLETFCASGSQRILITNDKNLGFVRSVNLGISQTAGNVILLNSDTEVTTGWFEALSRCLDSDPAIATATPWSNNGEIVSLPEFCRNNPPPGNPEAIARVAASVHAGQYPDLPTAVGFCMAISRRALDALGGFDEDTFGRGYGEENDFSMRADAAGLRNVLCADAYVVHHGNASFGPLGLKPDQSAMAKLLTKHPGYLERVQLFIHEDPLASYRDRLCHALAAEVP